MNDHKYAGIQQQLENCRREIGRKEAELERLRKALNEAIETIEDTAAMPVDTNHLREIASGKRRKD